MSVSMSMSAATLAPAALSSRQSVASKPTMAARASKSSRSALQVVSADYTPEEWAAKLAATPSIGASMAESNSIITKQAAKFTADANSAKYDKRAKLTFAAVNQGKNPALEAMQMDMGVASAAIARQLKESLKNKVNPAREAAEFDAKDAVARQIKTSEQAVWDAKLAALPSLGAWMDTAKNAKSPSEVAAEKSAIYTRKAQMVFAEVARLEKAKAVADANSKLYQEKANAVFAAVKAGKAPSAAAEVKSGNFLTGIVDGAMGLIKKVTKSFDEGDEKSDVEKDIEARVAERSAWIAKWRNDVRPSPPTSGVVDVQKDIDMRVAERSAWISKWRNDTQAKARAATWKTIDEGSVGTSKDLKKVIVVDLMDEEVINGEKVNTRQYSDGSVLYSFAEL